MISLSEIFSFWKLAHMKSTIVVIGFMSNMESSSQKWNREVPLFSIPIEAVESLRIHHAG